MRTVALLASIVALPAMAIPIKEVAKLDTVPVGIAVSRDNRIFLSFSRAVDKDEPFSVAELKRGKPVPYPVVGQNSIAAVEPTKCPVGAADHGFDRARR